MARVRDLSGNSPAALSPDGYDDPTPQSGVFPGQRARAVTPSDTVDLPLGPCRMLYIGGGSGGLVVIMAGDPDNQPTTFAGVPVGSKLELSVRRVLSTGTTATNIVAIY